MKSNLFLGSILFAASFGVSANDTGSQELKDEARSVIRSAGYKCNVVNGAYAKWSGGAVEVYCDDIYHYTIKDRGGRYIVIVND
ncbi:hypothetical protein SMETP3_34810 [Serratia marcescens]|uniref:hypothetical protein n=1 Tax=Serratia marcescens TaxID=615 RepID=UPI003988BD8A|nr:hypothetical protein SMETP3_34810 [Serratia marcescens]